MIIRPSSRGAHLKQRKVMEGGSSSRRQCRRPALLLEEGDLDSQVGGGGDLEVGEDAALSLVAKEERHEARRV
jgi:hypothetical protein